MSKPLSRAISGLLAPGTTIVTSAAAFLDAQRDAKTVSFLDSSTLANLDRLATDLGAPTDQLLPPPAWRKLLAAVSIGPVVVVCNEPLATAIGWLPSHPWLSHVLNADMLEHSMAKRHLANVMATVVGGQPRLADWVGGTGRRVRLTHASKSAERLGKMGEYFGLKGFGSPAIERLRAAAHELLTNAFYDAPVAAGVTQPIARTHDVALPHDCACDLVYGSDNDLAAVRVRDPFGSLSRARLVEVLTRCARTETPVELDETMGGAGLGLWRVLSTVSLVAISVINNRQTEVLIGIPKQDSPKKHPFAFHLFFKDGAQRRTWKLLSEDTGDPSDTSSVTMTVGPD
jgi:hypothetical protein